VATAEHDL